MFKHAASWFPQTTPAKQDPNLPSKTLQELSLVQPQGTTCVWLMVRVRAHRVFANMGC